MILNSVNSEGKVSLPIKIGGLKGNERITLFLASIYKNRKGDLTARAIYDMKSFYLSFYLSFVKCYHFLKTSGRTDECDKNKEKNGQK